MKILTKLKTTKKMAKIKMNFYKKKNLKVCIKTKQKNVDTAMNKRGVNIIGLNMKKNIIKKNGKMINKNFKIYKNDI